eukprot:CAMPEP_0184356350 /NCGR_PEP_ID=MMETSP1089-20130417/102209_1 /TAXON_ID=38269 ORGANISM="Gloeochaete wittrockiana, Strain SAG46.84" /NCGR_SAMPLE_ID=MMETSP1089 /ASSEMBLY_ACC=CAM_ASM_000445 /LENGTH=149 /DNA_ID=CAMNT_0026693537 /DNA_START=50 /DNA_END=499 /DNA_ORIENTATION=+
MPLGQEFYLRYFVGHKGRFGHEFIEFEFTSDGRMRYANNSQYKKEKMIRKEVFVGKEVLQELCRIIEDSEILKEDDSLWPEPDKVGKQELEIVLGDQHISFRTLKIGSVSQLQDTKDPDGLRVFHYLIQDLRSFVICLISLHFKLNPFG